MEITMKSQETVIKSQRIAHPIVIGVVAALWMTAVMLAHRLLFGISSVPGLITERIVPLVPGNISGTILGSLGQFAKIIPELSAIVAQLLVGGAVAIWYARSWGKENAPVWKQWAFGPLVGLGLWALTLAALWPVLYANYHGRPPAAGRALTIVAVFADYLLFGILLPMFFLLKWRAMIVELDGPTETGTRPVTRRHALSFVAAGALVAFGAFALGLRRISTLGYDGHRPAPPVQPITDNASFYIVTNGLADPHIAANVWRLEIGGAVTNPITLSFDDLKALPAVDETTTLACIGNPLGGGLLSTAIWHGVPLQSLLAMAKPEAGVTEVLFTANDDYTNTIEFEKVAAEGMIVAFGMNGAPLPQRHGYPVRIITPGRYGEKNVKWVTRIDLRKEHTKGYYESQGWDRDAVAKTLSRIDVPAKGDPVVVGQPVTMRGIAFGGLRGVSTVEVTTDGGKTWQPATITANPSPQSWVLWEFPWMPAARGNTMLGVRCYEKDGTPQSTKTEQNFPSGVSGLDFVPVAVQ